jgi:superoxide dismutase
MILALDIYEHSYHIDFSAKAATYVETFMEAIRWKNGDRLEECRSPADELEVRQKTKRR